MLEDIWEAFGATKLGYLSAVRKIDPFKKKLNFGLLSVLYTDKQN